MEWIVLFIIIIYVASKVAKHVSKDPDSNYEDNEIDASSIRITISSPGYSGMVEKKPDNFRWIPPGGTVNIADYKISDGMIYCGKHMKSVSGYSIEPGFINTELPVARSNPDREGKNMDYWPSYSEIPPSSRAAYLEWLAGGRVDPNNKYWICLSILLWTRKAPSS